jgi:hypothetical protein
MTSGSGQWTLPAGVYAFSRAIRAGQLVPSLAESLYGRGITDLGPRFDTRERQHP